jgi:hypothetical protein
MLLGGLDIRELKLGFFDTTAIRTRAWELATGCLSLGIQYQINMRANPAAAAACGDMAARAARPTERTLMPPIIGIITAMRRYGPG